MDVIWLQNIDGIMMARQFDTGKHSECYRPIPVHTPSSRRLSVSKPYMTSNAETTVSPRYDQDYDYKTTHYPSYPPNYPYDDSNKYKYGEQTSAQQSVAPGQPYTYEKGQVYSYDENNYESRGYAHQATPQLTPANYPQDSDYSRYPGYDGGRPYLGSDGSEYDKGRYGYGYDRSYYDADGRYMSDASRHDQRYVDSRHHDGRTSTENRDDTGRYDAAREDRRYDDDGRYEGREERYMERGDGRYEGRYQKENYYDRYYKHRPSREHASESSRY